MSNIHLTYSACASRNFTRSSVPDRSGFAARTFAMMILYGFGVGYMGSFWVGFVVMGTGRSTHNLLSP